MKGRFAQRSTGILPVGQTGVSPVSLLRCQARCLTATQAGCLCYVSCAMRPRSTLFTVSILVTSALAADPSFIPKEAAEAISAADLLKHIKVLASDEFEGRAPGSKGEELSVKYISEQFNALGLKAGNPNGSYTQDVPLAGIKSAPTASLVANGKEPMELKFPDDYVASSARLQPE